MIGKIYKLTPHKCCEFYIGSTTDMKMRETKHRTDSKNVTAKLYEKIREMGGFDMKVLYEYECENETELRMEEQRCMDKMNPTLNNNRAYNSEEDTIENKKQYYEQNKDTIREKQKQYYEQNKDALCEKQKQYKEQNKDAILEYQKQYYEQNKDEAKKYYEQNKADLKKKITCICGCVVAKQQLNRHKQTSKHIKLMEKVI